MGGCGRRGCLAAWLPGVLVMTIGLLRVPPEDRSRIELTVTPQSCFCPSVDEKRERVGAWQTSDCCDTQACDVTSMTL